MSTISSPLQVIPSQNRLWWSWIHKQGKLLTAGENECKCLTLLVVYMLWTHTFPPTLSPSPYHLVLPSRSPFNCLCLPLQFRTPCTSSFQLQKFSFPPLIFSSLLPLCRLPSLYSGALSLSLSPTVPSRNSSFPPPLFRSVPSRLYRPAFPPHPFFLSTPIS